LGGLSSHRATLPASCRESGRLSAGTAGGAPLGELVARDCRWLLVAGTLSGELGEIVLHLAPDPPDRDAEDSLSTLHQVEHLVGRGALVHAGTVAHQRD